jgi:hypothetical protein
MKNKSFLIYILTYPIIFVFFTVAFEKFKFSSGSTLLDVAILMLLTGVTGYIFSYYFGGRKNG